MKTIVIYRLGSLGDTLVALPCFHKIEEAFPHTRRVVLTNVPVSTKAAPLEVILGPGGLLDGVVEYPIGVRSLKDFWALRRRLRKTGADTLVYLAANRGRWSVLRDVMFFRLCGFSKIIGAPLSTDLLNNRTDPFDGSEEPEAERLARTLSHLGPVNLDSQDAWDLRITPAEATKASDALEPLNGKHFFAINMGGKVVQKDWGMSNWQRLLASLSLELHQYRVVVVGATEDSDRADQLLLKWPSGGLNLCGTLTPRECASALRQADFFIGHDSGPLHLAAAVQVPCVGLFGDYNRPKKWHPYGKQHRILHNLGGVQCVQVEQVHDAVLDIVNRRQRASNSVPA